MKTGKRELVESWIRRAVRRELTEIIAGEEDPAARTALHGIETRMQNCVSAEVYDAYRWLELCDIFEWRKRKVPE